jgi:transcriptional regulator with XRE-family HTH domain
MIIGDRLRDLREAKQLSQGDIEKRTGLLRCYLSRVENGHTVPAIETLEKMARALEVPMYQLFYEGEEPPEVPKPVAGNGDQWGTSGRAGRYLFKLRRALAQMQPDDRKLLFNVTQRMASRKR